MIFRSGLIICCLSSLTQDDASTRVVESSEDTSYQDEDLLDIETLLDDDTLMSISFE